MEIVYVLIITALLCSRASSKKATAAVWVDDGNGHTIKAELPPIDAKVLKMHMMDIFGLHGLHRHRHHRKRKSEGSAPKFLKEIYDALDERGHAPHLDPQYRAAVNASNTIITFVNRASEHNKHHESNRHLFFDVSDVHYSYELLGAELRVHRSKKWPRHHKHNEIILHVYEDSKETKSHNVLAKTTLPEEGWAAINVTQAVSNAIFINPHVMLRLAVTYPGLKHEMKLHEIGLTGSHGHEDLKPFLVGFFSRPENEREIKRVRRSPGPKTDYKNPYLALPLESKSNEARGRSVENECQKRPLHVSFKDLGWGDWVIAPEGYDANFCEGRCEFPMLANMNASNHAIIQTLVKMKNAIIEGERTPPSACCAPKDLTTISVLYYDYSSNVVLKKYPKMIVKTCGCF